MRAIQLSVAFVAVMVLTAGDVEGVVYMRSDVGQPWDGFVIPGATGVDSNELAMDAVFGAGGWSDLRYETADPLSVFSESNSFAFLEGGDDNANELESFLNSNIGTIESWVADGGSLFVNAAPNEGDGMSFGFGGVELDYSNYSQDPNVAVDSSHPIFTGPFPTATSFEGNWFGHSYVTGPGLTSLIEDDVNGVLLAEKDYGLGHVMFGGMTLASYHTPETEAFNLRANILDYAADQANNRPAPVPEPVSAGLLGVGLLGLAAGTRRRRVA